MPYYTAIGGSLVPSLFIKWTGGPPVTPEEIDSQIVQARALDLPTIKSRVDAVPDNGRKLAIVGGGPSINVHIDTLKDWDGDIWTINGAYHWAAGRGIETTFIACDPHIIVADWAKNVKKALVTTRCHGKVFEVLKANDATVKMFELDGENRIMGGSSTATISAHIAICEGYKDVTYFGIESSYQPGWSHAFMHERRDHELIVEAAGEQFYTAPDYLIQALEMSQFLRVSTFKEESGGLLRALIKDSGFRIIWVSEGLYKILTPINGETAELPTPFPVPIRDAVAA